MTNFLTRINPTILFVNSHNSLLRNCPVFRGREKSAQSIHPLSAAAAAASDHYRNNETDQSFSSAAAAGQTMKPPPSSLDPKPINYDLDS